MLTVVWVYHDPVGWKRPSGTFVKIKIITMKTSTWIILGVLVAAGGGAAYYFTHRLKQNKYAPGTLVRNPTTGAIYVIDPTGVARWIKSLETLRSLFPGITAIDIPDAPSLPKGADIP